jgi:hypothetical protein
MLREGTYASGNYFINAAGSDLLAVIFVAKFCSRLRLREWGGTG